MRPSATSEREPLPFSPSAAGCAYSVHVNAGQWGRCRIWRPPVLGDRKRPCGFASAAGHRRTPGITAQEGFLRLRTTLQFVGADTRHNVIVATSAVPDEGRGDDLDQYRGLRAPWVAFAMCAVLDEIERHSAGLDEQTLRVVLDVCRTITREDPAPDDGVS